MNVVYQLHYFKNSTKNRITSGLIGNYKDAKTAQNDMSLFIQKNQNHLNEFLAFFLLGFKFDNSVLARYEYASLTSFLPDGTLNDKLLIDEDGIFHGRPESRIRFQHGDIVEVYNRYEKSFEPVIVDSPPMTDARVTSIISKHPEFKILLDQTDDCYMVYGLGVGDTHDHIMSPFVFPVRDIYPSGIYDALRMKLQEMNSEN